MKTKFACVAMVCAALSLSGCADSPQNRIVGKWEAGQTGAKLTAEFSKDGKAKIGMFGMASEGTYKVNGDEMEWTLNGTTTRYKVKVSATDLELTSDGKTITYKKV
jgi:uncharacterized protein (TIGR03066 family)